jgi:hypothetical protein
MHFWLLTARLRPVRGEPGGLRPRKMGLNWFMPAFAKSRVGSSCGTTGLAAQKVWALDSKKEMKPARIALPDTSRDDMMGGDVLLETAAKTDLVWIVLKENAQCLTCETQG